VTRFDEIQLGKKKIIFSSSSSSSFDVETSFGGWRDENDDKRPRQKKVLFSVCVCVW
jgi:hypothetical protein